MKKLKNKYKDKEVTLNISNDLVDYIIEKSNYEELGARQVKKIIKNSIENIILDKIILGENKISISVKDLLEEQPQ